MTRNTERTNIPPYAKNSALQLVVASGTTYIMFHFAKVLLLMMNHPKAEVFRLLFPNIGLGVKEILSQKWWTILTYGWVHHGFFEWLTNMIWLYCFGASLQKLFSYKELFPIFILGIIAGGFSFEYAQFYFMQQDIYDAHYFLGATAGITAMAVALLIAEPLHFFTISGKLKVPMMLLIFIFLGLNIYILTPEKINSLILLSGGALIGLVYGILLRRSIFIGTFIYDSLNKIQTKMNPVDERPTIKENQARLKVLKTMYVPKIDISQEQIDEILDKVLSKGFHALTQQEKEILNRAGK